MLFHMPTTETIMLGSTEMWEIFNYTADAHPMHLHQVQYQVLGRYMMNQSDINGDGVVDQSDYTAAADLNQTAWSTILAAPSHCDPKTQAPRIRCGSARARC